MPLYKDTLLVPAFSEAILAQLQSMPAQDEKTARRRRTEVLAEALNSYFFAGRMFIFKSPFYINPECREDDGRTVMFVGPEPRALGFENRDDARDFIDALVRSWGFNDIVVKYNGNPETVEKLNRNETEAKVNAAVRDAIAARYGQDMAEAALRTRTPGMYTDVRLSSTKIFNELVQQGVPATFGGRREVELPFTLPDGNGTTFRLKVERSGLIADLTAHFFGERKFTKIDPFFMYVQQGTESTSYNLMIQVSPKTLGYSSAQEAHDSIRKLAAELGYPDEARTLRPVQAAMHTLADIEFYEKDPTVGRRVVITGYSIPKA